MENQDKNGNSNDGRIHRLSDGAIVNRDENLWVRGNWCLPQAQRQRESEVNTPYGLSPLGFLTYAADGRVTALISYGGRKPLSGGGGPRAQEEQAEAFRTFLAYAGRYTLSGDKVTHHIEISSIQNYVDRDLVRSVKFQSDQLILVTPPTPVNGKVQIIELTWQRLSLGS